MTGEDDIARFDSRQYRHYQALVKTGQMVVVVVRQEGWTSLTVAEDAQMRVGKRIQIAKGPT